MAPSQRKPNSPFVLLACVALVSAPPIVFLNRPQWFATAFVGTVGVWTVNPWPTSGEPLILRVGARDGLDTSLMKLEVTVDGQTHSSTWPDPLWTSVVAQNEGWSTRDVTVPLPSRAAGDVLPVAVHAEYVVAENDDGRHFTSHLATRDLSLPVTIASPMRATVGRYGEWVVALALLLAAIWSMRRVYARAADQDSRVSRWRSELLVGGLGVFGLLGIPVFVTPALRAVPHSATNLSMVLVVGWMLAPVLALAAFRPRSPTPSSPTPSEGATSPPPSQPPSGG